MMELPEAAVISEQVNATFKGKRIESVIANQSPHKFAWFYGDPDNYDALLRGHTIDGAISHGGMVEISAGPALIVLAEGLNLRYYPEGEKLPKKHQLLLEFDDGSSLVGSVQMYGAAWAFPEGQFDNQYYLNSKRRPSPLTDAFDYAHFESLLEGQRLGSLSAKAFLATEQRIPGLGNGVLQDILWTARIHPKRKMATVSTEELHTLFDAVKSVLRKMTSLGGRDTERDLFGSPGRYQTVLSRNTVDSPCPECGTIIQKAAYLGGSIYFCGGCQKE
jgi:formamidopyrimidine-DNA glycosylase